ncbi:MULTISPECIES: 2-hydroxyacid dehydrogenase [Burkholderiaceae]|uniref:D-3-phosphoglycerate dehydrogenase n=1 Tax=Caballeronia sordidicola TaxID=196367 RepID=A0A242MRB5_CABSO|nr:MULTISPECIES: glyoxylate/hydroxypyruvate reductase A [Burkholderiaceae]AME25824.1 glyoxylate/hydroxypyruvate reductase A [Burkholderia sp. PAMC 26561]OTP73872.1 D-3-phosphoglycerate dehydrogenase [Caballeronia sordidicola]
MTKLVFISSGYDMSPLAPAIIAAAPELEVHAFGTHEANDAQVAVCWKPPAGALRSLPNLRLVHGVAAGVDNILCDPHFPAVPLCRVVDPDQARAMSEYVMWGVLHFHRRFDQVLVNQRHASWTLPEQTRASDCTVGVMGLGEIGSRVALDLLRAGFSVAGWSRSPKHLPGVATFNGRDALPAFLERIDTLVCLLPLTSETRGLLNADLFRQLRPGTKLIHVGRGEHLDAEALLSALDSGQVGGALVDVFPNEPLPSDDPLWQHPKVIVTPHMAAISTLDTIGSQIAQNVRRMVRGEPLLNQVDIARH